MSGLHAPLPAFGNRLRLSAGGEVFAIRRLQVGGKVGSLAQPLRRCQPICRVCEPGAVAVVRGPIAARALDALQHGKQPGIFCQPALQQAPLPQQRLVRRLDGFLAGVLGNIGSEQALLDEVLDQRSRLGGNFGQPGDAATRGTGVGIDASQPGYEAASQQRQPCEAVPRDRRVGVGSLEGALDRRFDGAPDAAEASILEQP